MSKKYTNHFNINFVMGVIAVEEESHLQAIEYFKSAIEKAPNFTEAYFNLGFCYKHEVKIVPMVHAYKMVIKTGEPDDVIVQQAQETLDMLVKSVQENNGISLDEYMACNEIFDKGVEEMTLESWQTAIMHFKEVLELDNNHTQSYGNLGICYAHLGENKSAVDSLEKALQIDPTYGVALINLEFIKGLEEGECLDGRMKIIDYYKDYPEGAESYIEELIIEGEAK